MSARYEPDEYERHQPYYSSDGRYLTVNNSYGTRQQHASKPLKGRRLSLHRGYHSEIDTTGRHEDTRATGLGAGHLTNLASDEGEPVKSRRNERRSHFTSVERPSTTRGEEHSPRVSPLPEIRLPVSRTSVEDVWSSEDDDEVSTESEPEDQVRTTNENASSRSTPKRRGEHAFHIHQPKTRGSVKPVPIARAFKVPSTTQAHRSRTDITVKDNYDDDEDSASQAAKIPRSRSKSTSDATSHRAIIKSRGKHRPGSGSNFESFRISTNITPDDSRSEAGNLLAEQRPWQPTGTGSSSTGLSHTAASTFSVSGVLGPKSYAYRELQDAMEFRLVKVLPEKTSKLKCEIVHASLDNPPNYVAISYAWGDGVDTKSLVLEGATISVAASLHDALKAVRKRDTMILVWVDGLSIDQHNKAERASQVQLMGHIYGRATSVAIWLGPKADDSELAIQLLEKIQDNRVSNDRIKAVENADSAALHSLFKRDYWSRLWVVQEAYLAQRKVVCCGSSKLPWDVYKLASDVLWEHESDPHLREGPSSFPDMHSIVGLGAESLLEVLRACRKKLSENPRDKIFGVLGMLPEETRKELPVDYDRSIKSLYIDVADLIISSTRRLDVIREAIHFPPYVSSTGLPTWCPDWAHIPETSALRERHFSAAGDTDAVYEFHENERKLEISAIELGTIQATGVAVGTLCALQDYLMAFLHWRMLLLATFSISEDEEANNPLVETFCQTLSLGQVPKKWKDSWMTPCYQAFSSLIHKRMRRFPLDRDFQRRASLAVLRKEEMRPFVQKHFGDRMMGRTFCITKDGLMGMGTGFMRSGDIVVVPFGCSTPILLRAEGRRNEFRYVGDVYIHGYMHGEALESDKSVRKYMLH